MIHTLEKKKRKKLVRRIKNLSGCYQCSSITAVTTNLKALCTCARCLINVYILTEICPYSSKLVKFRLYFTCFILDWREITDMHCLYNNYALMCALHPNCIGIISRQKSIMIVKVDFKPLS